jgi:hypothetical protein
MAAGSASSQQLRFDVESAQTLPADSRVTPPIDSPKQTVELLAPMLFGLSHNPPLLSRGQKGSENPPAKPNETNGRISTIRPCQKVWVVAHSKRRRARVVARDRRPPANQRPVVAKFNVACKK